MTDIIRPFTWLALLNKDREVVLSTLRELKEMEVPMQEGLLERPEEWIESHRWICWDGNKICGLSSPLSIKDRELTKEAFIGRFKVKTLS